MIAARNRPRPEPVCNGRTATEVGAAIWDRDTAEERLVAEWGLTPAEVARCWNWWVAEHLASGDLAPAGGHLVAAPLPLPRHAKPRED